MEKGGQLEEIIEKKGERQPPSMPRLLYRQAVRVLPPRVREIVPQERKNIREEIFAWAQAFTKNASIFDSGSSRQQIIAKELLNQWDNQLELYQYSIRLARQRHDDQYRALKDVAQRARYWVGSGRERAESALKVSIANLENDMRNIRVGFERFTSNVVSELRAVLLELRGSGTVLPKEDQAPPRRQIGITGRGDRRDG